MGINLSSINSCTIVTGCEGNLIQYALPTHVTRSTCLKEDFIALDRLFSSGYPELCLARKGTSSSSLVVSTPRYVYIHALHYFYFDEKAISISNKPVLISYGK